MQHRLAIIAVLTALLALLEVWLAAQPALAAVATPKQARAREQLHEVLAELRALLDALRAQQAAVDPEAPARPHHPSFGHPPRTRLTTAVQRLATLPHPGTGPPIGPPPATAFLSTPTPC